MTKVIEIAISKNYKGKMQRIESVQAIAGNGLVGDRHFKENNHIKSQITLIEIENINYYNNKTGTFIPPINFRRNIITEGIQLNELIGREFLVGKVKLRAHDLCRPCKYLQEKLNQNNLVKEFLHKGGLRCEILTSGEIVVGDIIRKADD